MGDRMHYSQYGYTVNLDTFSKVKNQCSYFTIIIYREALRYSFLGGSSSLDFSEVSQMDLAPIVTMA